MGNRLYINGMGCISAQAGDIFSGEITQYTESIIPAVSPNYKDFIKPMMLRRMSKAVKMGVTSALMALQEAEVSVPEAIITGTGEGCKDDTEKFLENILQENEGLLTPTAFIQSTHNTIGGQIALQLKCTGYNMTFTQNAASLESAFADAQLQFLENQGLKNILVGGVEEIAKITTGFGYLDGQLKQRKIHNLELFNCVSPGTIISEGAQFFNLSSEKKDTSYAELKDVTLFNSASPEAVEGKIREFLGLNGRHLAEIDAVILGKNGDSRYDIFYQPLQDGIFINKLQLGYKHLAGDYNSVTGYAVWLASKILKNQNIPEVLTLNQTNVAAPRNFLVYNQYLGKNHGLILLNAV